MVTAAMPIFDVTRDSPFEPTEELCRTVRAMAGFGVPQDDIAVLLDIDVKTLHQHFQRDLDRGTIEATAKVAQTLFQMATVDKNVSAAIFWMKARGGWREKTSIEQLGPDGNPIMPGATYVLQIER
jgi:hypothetical protein